MLAQLSGSTFERVMGSLNAAMMKMFSYTTPPSTKANAKSSVKVLDVQFNVILGRRGLRRATNVTILHKPTGRYNSYSGTQTVKSLQPDTAQLYTAKKCAQSHGYFVFKRNLGRTILIDSGAFVSVISARLLKADSFEKYNLSSASGCSLKTVGSVKLNIDLGFKNAINHRFVVVESLSVGAIIGLDFLISQGLIVNSAECYLHQAGSIVNVKLIFGDLTSSEMKVFCGENLLDRSYDQQLEALENAKPLLSPMLDEADMESEPIESIRHLLSPDPTEYHVNLVTSQSTPLTIEEQDDKSFRNLTYKCRGVIADFPRVTTFPSYHDPPRHSVSLDIELTDDIRFLRQRARRCTPRQLEILRSTFLDFIERNVVTRDCPSHVCPTTIVTKKNGKPRVCIDYTRLNNITKWINYPLPQMNSLTSIVTPSHRFFSVLDLKEAYFSLPLTPQASQYAGIITPDGAFLPKRCQFGLRNAPFKFCELIDRVTEGLKDFVFTYLDDFLIFSKSPVEHLIHLRTVMQRLDDFGLFINPDKCIFGKKTVSFLGRTISAEGVTVEETAVNVILQQQPPSTLRKL